MKSLCRAFVLYCCFTIEIRIHATEVPLECLSKNSFPCAQELKAGQKSKNFSALEESLIIHLSKKQIQVVRGKITCEGACDIMTPVARFSSSKVRMILERTKENIGVQVVQGVVQIHRRGLKESDQIPEGFMVHVGPIVDGNVQIDIPAALKGQLFKAAQDQSVSMMRDSVLREIASADLLKKRSDAQTQIQLKEEAHFKKLFRQRNQIE